MECPAVFPVPGQHAAVELYDYVLEPEDYSVGQIQEPLGWKKPRLSLASETWNLPSIGLFYLSLPLVLILFLK